MKWTVGATLIKGRYLASVLGWCVCFHSILQICVSCQPPPWSFKRGRASYGYQKSFQGWLHAWASPVKRMPRTGKNDDKIPLKHPVLPLPLSIKEAIHLQKACLVWTFSLTIWDTYLKLVWLPWCLKQYKNRLTSSLIYLIIYIPPTLKTQALGGLQTLKRLQYKTDKNTQ